nr:hypothetical protein [Tanacetum cinerariifolium]
MEDHMARTLIKNGARLVQPMIREKVSFEIKCHIMKELRDTSFGGTDEEDSNEHVDKVLEISKMFNFPSVPKDRIMLTIFPKNLIATARIWVKSEPRGLDAPTRQMLDLQGPLSKMTHVNLKKAIQDMVDDSKMWHDGNNKRRRIVDNSAGLAGITAKLNKLGREVP